LNLIAKYPNSAEGKLGYYQVISNNYGGYNMKQFI